MGVDDAAIPALAKNLESCHGSSLPVEERSRQLRKLYAQWALHMAAWMLLADPRLLVFMRHFKGDTGACARYQSRGVSLMMLSRMVLAPVLAALSDAFGRRALLVFGPLWCLHLRSLELLRPRAFTMLCTLSLSALVDAAPQGIMTAIADLHHGDTVGAGAALAQLQGLTFAGAVLGPTVSSTLAARSVQLPLALSALLSGAQAFLALRSRDTLPPERKVPLADADWSKAASPLAWSRLFLSGPRLAVTAAAQLLAFAIEPILIGRIGTLVFAESLKWDTSMRGRYSSLESLVAIPGVLLGSRLAKAMGGPLAMALAAGVTAVQHGLSAFWVRASWQQLATLPLSLVQGTGSTALASLSLEAGEAAGLGQAELRGCLQSLQSLGSLLCTVLWTRWFTRCTSMSRPRLFFVGPALVALAQLLLGLIALRVSPGKSLGA